MKIHKHKYWTRVFLFLLFVSCCAITRAQNTLVLNGAITVLNAGTAGSPVYLVVNETNTLGIARLAGGGHIHSENQYNFVRWVSGTGTGSYVIPFGVGGNPADYIPFTFNKTTAGNSDLDMSTWATNVQNIPHAATTNVGPVTSMTGTADSVLYALDRFWDIQTSGATTADLTFSYLGVENTTSNPTDTVKAQHWNGAAWDPQVGPGNLGVVAGVGTVGPFVGQTTFSPWILSTIPVCPTATISFPTNYCDNDTTPVLITFSGGLGGLYTASPVGLAIDSLTGTVIPANSTPGTYTVTYTIDSTAVCAIFTTVTNITINATSTSPQATSICQGDSILLGGIFQTTAGIYTDTLVNANGCDSMIVTTLTVDPLNSITANPNPPICFGDPIVLTAASSGNGVITWYSDPNGTTVIGTGSPFSPTVPGIGTYVFYVNEVGACPSAMDSVVLIVGGVQAIITANPITGTIPLTVTFNGAGSVGGITGYSWDFDGDGNIDDTLSNGSFVYTTIGTYTAMLIVTDGTCSDTVYITIDAFGESAILIPNVFTPNGDGQNDLFTVDGVNLKTVEGVIFNRWGQKLFDWNGVKGGWDGRTTAGSEVPDGTYFYIINAVGEDDTEYFKKGGVSLIR